MSTNMLTRLRKSWSISPAPVPTIFERQRTSSGEAWASAVAAFVAFVFFAPPVLALWLAIYLGATFGLPRLLPSDRTARLAGIVAAPLLWVPVVHSGDRLVNGVSLAVICLYGLLAKPSPTNRSRPRQSPGATTA